MKPAASSAGVRGRYGGFGVKSVRSLVGEEDPPPPPKPVNSTTSPGASFRAEPDIWY